MEPGFRELDARERGLLEKLLEPELPGRDELRAQLASVTGKQIAEDGTLKLQCASGPPSPSEYLLASEGICKDADGGKISVLLHISRNGFMDMLEIVKYTGDPIINPPSARELVLLVPEQRGHKTE